MIDILIVGAGSCGLCAAKTFIQYDQNADIVLVDAHATLGGVWSQEQLYPTLKTNNFWSTIDFTDFPMDERFGIRPGQHVTGEAMHKYLQAYAQHFGLIRRIRLNTRVIDIQRIESGSGWTVQVDSDKDTVEVLTCRKLVIATGVLSVPHMPKLQGIADFDAPFIHSSQVGRNAEKIMQNPDVKTVAILGGGKSAYDCVYLAASTGHKIEWIIRKSGRGPAWVLPPQALLGPFKIWREKLVTRRILSLMSPCIWRDFSGFAWLRKFLHFTSIGRSIAQKFWSAAHAGGVRDGRYRTDEKLKALEPEQNMFWYGTATGALNYDKDILSYIRSGQVTVRREDIAHLSDHQIHLADGTELSVDALIASTGFSGKPTISFSPKSIHSDLGVPSSDYDQSQRFFWSELNNEADLAIGTQFPRLLRGPFKAPDSDTPQPFNPGMTAEVSYTPWRLYRGIAPPGLTAAGDHSLVFIGMISNSATAIRLEVQCLWALAYLNGKLSSIDKNISEKKVFRETALFQRFTQHRAPYGHGAFYPDLIFEQIPYLDVLLNDLGLETRRKKNVFRELFEPYSQLDYQNIVLDWVRKNR